MAQPGVAGGHSFVDRCSPAEPLLAFIPTRTPIFGEADFVLGPAQVLLTATPVDGAGGGLPVEAFRDVTLLDEAAIESVRRRGAARSGQRRAAGRFPPRPGRSGPPGRRVRPGAVPGPVRRWLTRGAAVSERPPRPTPPGPDATSVGLGPAPGRAVTSAARERRGEPHPGRLARAGRRRPEGPQPRRAGAHPARGHRRQAPLHRGRRRRTSTPTPCRASPPSPGACGRPCTPTGRGPSASTPASPPPRSPTPSTGATSPPASRACRSRSTSPPTGATTPTTPGSRATWARPAWPSTRSRT